MGSENFRLPQGASPADGDGAAGPTAEATAPGPAASGVDGHDQVGERFRALLAEFRGKLESELRSWLTAKEQAAAVESAASRELTDVLTGFVAREGKRLRPALLYYAYRACGGHSDEVIMPMAMAVELLHTYLLIHDDIMDHADTRRGEPSAHLLFRDLHRQRDWRGSSEHFGESVGILLGDLAQSYSLELYSSVHPAPEVEEQFRLDYSAMCQEVILGQYLEMTAGYRDHLEEDELLRVLRMKSGRYSVERPVQLGALLARAPESTRDRLNEYGLRLGEAFQLQDDLLGMFGDARTVGKPVGSDLLEGKFTLLIHHALGELPDQERRVLLGALGDSTLEPSEVRAAQQRIEASGARRRVEQMVDQRLDQARQALAGLELKRDGSDFLIGLIDYLRGRKR